MDLNPIKSNSTTGPSSPDSLNTTSSSAQKGDSPSLLLKFRRSADGRITVAPPTTSKRQIDDLQSSAASSHSAAEGKKQKIDNVTTELKTAADTEEIGDDSDILSVEGENDREQGWNISTENIEKLHQDFDPAAQS